MASSATETGATEPTEISVAIALKGACFHTQFPRAYTQVTHFRPAETYQTLSTHRLTVVTGSTIQNHLEKLAGVFVPIVT